MGKVIQDSISTEDILLSIDEYNKGVINLINETKKTVILGDLTIEFEKISDFEILHLTSGYNLDTRGNQIFNCFILLLQHLDII